MQNLTNYKVSSYNRHYHDRYKERTYTTYEGLLTLITNKVQCIRFLMEHDIIEKQMMCPKCTEPMKLVQSKSKHSSSDGFVWRCRRMAGGVRHEVERSIRKESWLEDCNLTIEECLKEIYFWSTRFSQQQVIMP